MGHNLGDGHLDHILTHSLPIFFFSCTHTTSHTAILPNYLVHLCLPICHSILQTPAYGLHLDPFLLSLNTLTPHTTTHMCVPASCHLVCEREGEKEMWPGLGGHTLPRGKLPPRSDKSWHSCTPIPPSCLSSVSLDRHLQSPPAHGHPHEDERSLPSLCCEHTRRSMSSTLASPPYTP
jgi:hypothetical protein